MSSVTGECNDRTPVTGDSPCPLVWSRVGVPECADAGRLQSLLHGPWQASADTAERTDVSTTQRTYTHTHTASVRGVHRVIQPFTSVFVTQLQLLAKCVTSTRCAGMGWDGMGWDGMGWDGMGWDGMGWDGMCIAAGTWLAW